MNQAPNMDDVIDQLNQMSGFFTTAIGNRTQAMIDHNTAFIATLRDKLQQLKLIIDRLNVRVLEILNRVQQIDPRLQQLQEELRYANERLANSGATNQLLEDTIKGLEDQIDVLNQEKERYILDLQRILGELNQRIQEVGNIEADKIQMDPQDLNALEESINILSGNIDLLFNSPAAGNGGPGGNGPPQGGPPPGGNGGPPGSGRQQAHQLLNNYVNPLHRNNRNNQIPPGEIRRPNNQLDTNKVFSRPKSTSKPYPQEGVRELMKKFEHSRDIPENQKIIEKRSTKNNSFKFGGRQHTRRRKYSTKKRGGYNIDNPNPSNTKKHNKRRNSSTSSSSSTPSTSHHSKKGLGRGKKTRKSRKSRKTNK